MTRLVVPTVAAAVLALAGGVRADHHLTDATEAPSCRRCGMDRGKFAATRMVVEYDDGAKVPACSLHCVAVELANELDRTPAVIRVADQGTQVLVDAQQAIWVVGGSKPGVMSRRGKWAFAERAAAEAFVAKHGGALASFEEAMRAAYEDMYEDGRTIRERRKATKARRPAAAEQATPQGREAR